ncbi:chloramphenicol resistance protein [Thozetella sp. PMI_491]|nr:chloramphenicol resistance protein [Thozetella sp. PMI_491]
MSAPEEPTIGGIRGGTDIDRFSVFTTAEKWLIVGMIAYAAWFSTLSSFIYYPAIHLLSETLAVSVDKINLTVTTYMAVATIAPTLIGDTSDVIGRRPVYIVTLALYIAADIAIAMTQSYSALLGLRALQALAISGTISIAYGVVADVAPPAERGTFISAVSFVITIAPSLGPILGGALAYVAGWPWIFWFLAMAAGAGLTTIILFLPETSRNLVGNGSIRPPSHLQLPVPRIMSHWGKSSTHPPRARGVPNPLRSLTILARKDNAIIIFSCGLIYVVYTCINASLSLLFIDIYSLNQWQAGLVYLPFGLGGAVSTFISAPLLDNAYRKARAEQGLSTDKVKGDDLDSFSVEKARLRVIWAPMAATSASVVGFGWVLHYHVHMAVPLFFQFIAGFCMQLDFSVGFRTFRMLLYILGCSLAVRQIYNTLLVDKNHRTPAAAHASSNIVRCTLAAITVSFLQSLIDSIGIGWTFTFMAGLCFVATLLFVVDYLKGTLWRQKKLE